MNEKLEPTSLMGDVGSKLLLLIIGSINHQVIEAVQQHPVIPVTDCILTLEPEPLTIAELGRDDSVLLPDLTAEFFHVSLESLQF